MQRATTERIKRRHEPLLGLHLQVGSPNDGDKTRRKHIGVEEAFTPDAATIENLEEPGQR